MPKSVARQSSRLAVASQAVALESTLAKVVTSRGASRNGTAKRVVELSGREQIPTADNPVEKNRRPVAARPAARWQTKAGTTTAGAASGGGEATLPAAKASPTAKPASTRLSSGTAVEPVAPASALTTAKAPLAKPVGTATRAEPGRAEVGKAEAGKQEQATSPLMSLADDALLQRIRTGDAHAGDTLIRRYAQPLLRYLQRLVGDDLAEELHQQTWVSVLDNLDKFDPTVATHHSGSGGFKAWLFRIATNKANDLWRSKGRERAAKEGLRLVSGQDTPWAGHKAEGREMEDKLIQAIGRLPESQRQVLALRYYSNMKFIDIAALLGCPLNTALGRVHKAMIKLRQLMDD